MIKQPSVFHTLTKCLLALLLVFAAQNSMALTECFNDPVVSERYRALLKQLRCVKCDNQSLFDSPSGIADDIRSKVCKQVKYSDMTNDEIKDYFVERYDEYILFTPRAWYWWAMPIIGLILGALCIVYFRRTKPQVSPATNSSANSAPNSTHSSSQNQSAGVKDTQQVVKQLLKSKDDQ